MGFNIGTQPNDYHDHLPKNIDLLNRMKQLHMDAVKLEHKDDIKAAILNLSKGQSLTARQAGIWSIYNKLIPSK